MTTELDLLPLKKEDFKIRASSSDPKIWVDFVERERLRCAIRGLKDDLFHALSHSDISDQTIAEIVDKFFGVLEKGDKKQ